MIRTLALACALALGGCASLTPGTGQAVLSNLQGCERHYNGVISAGLGAGFSGSVRIDCPAGTVAQPEPVP